MPYTKAPLVSISASLPVTLAIPYLFIVISTRIQGGVVVVV